MKFVYLDTSYVLSVPIIGLNIIYTKFWILLILPSTYILTEPYLNSKHDSR